MKDLRARNALVTGASGGIGRQIAKALARAGANVAVSGRREDVLTGLAGELRELGVRAEVVPADLSDLAQAEALIDRSEQAIGPLDVLVNNAGIEVAAAFTRYARDELTSMIDINLTAPLLMTRHVVPGMLARAQGHVVFISSTAGKVGPAYQAPYAATKAGLVALTQALRAEYLKAPVGFSVVCPGFTAGEGMYQRMIEQGVESNRLLGSTTTEKVAERVVEAIRKDRPQVIESGAPLRPMLAVAELTPRLVEYATDWIGANDIFRRQAAANGREG